MTLTTAGPLAAEDAKKNCRDDAILVFDASGSMAGTDMNTVSPHIAKVREALASVLPSISPIRNLGLVTYGPGPWGRCDNIELNVAP
jgi:Ca-activated chloride channel family protein